MPIRVKCESCKKTLSVKDHLAGKKIKCPVCQGVVVVPAVSVSDPAAAPKAPAPKAAPAPKTKPAAPPAAGPVKKPAAAPKDIATKPPAEKTPPNGSADGAKRNGVPPKKPESEPVELPPENVEDEALAAFIDEPTAEEEGPPPVIDFICEFCDAPVQLPIDQAGKRVQCPNDDCRRLIKVPMPKVEGKRDWRKMDRRGPSAAIVSQPEELENAWGTETSTRARHDSLAQAGAVAAPKKPPIGVLGWLRRGVIFFCVIGVLGAGGLGIRKLRSTTHTKESIRDIRIFLGAEGKEPKIKNLALRAEAHRALAALYMREPNKAPEAMENFTVAFVLLERRLKAIEEEATDKRDPAINEQLLLIELILELTELGGNEDEAIAKKKQRWDPVRRELNQGLSKITSPEVQVLALRELSTRLIDKKQADLTLLALQLGNNLGNPDTNPKPLAFRQYIALVYAEGDAETKKNLPPEPDLAKPEEIKDLDGHERVGYAEGYARTGDFKKALELATAKGKSGDRLEACIGVAWVALPKNRAESANAFKEALGILQKEKDANPTSWNQLELVKLGARLDDLDSVKPLVESLPPAFKLRAELEIFLAKLEKSSSTSLDELAEIETKDPDGATLGLAWTTWARTNGASRDQNRKACDNRYPTVPLQPGVSAEMLRAMADVGSYLGAKK